MSTVLEVTYRSFCPVSFNGAHFEGSFRYCGCALPAQSSAQKLMSLPGSRGPVWPVLSCLLAEGVKRKDGAEKTILVAFRNLVGE